MPIIHQGDTTVAHHHLGSSPYLLITFIGAFIEHEADSFYLLKRLIESTDIDCVGITSRLRNLYITPEMDLVIEKIHGIRRPDQKVIVIGQSSGAYAALKFADRLGADHVLAFSPIFSMDEGDLGLTDQMVYEKSILRGAIRFHRVPPEVIRPGMRPGVEDCSVAPIIIYDSRNENDSYAAARYAGTLPAATFVPAPNLGHASLNTIEGTQGQLLLELLSLLVRDDRDAAVRLLLGMSRDNEDALCDLVLRIARWRPAMVPRVLRMPRIVANIREEVRHDHPFNIVMVYELVARGDLTAALAQLRQLYPNLFPASAGAAPPRRRLSLVLSCHGHVLSYDKHHAEVTFAKNTLRSKDFTPVLLDDTSDTPRMIILAPSSDLPVVVDRKSGAESGESFEVVALPDTALIALRRNNALLRTDRDGPPIFAGGEALTWERFALIPIPDPDLLRERAGINWFDQTTMHARDDAPASTAPARARKAAFRSVLQRFFTG